MSIAIDGPAGTGKSTVTQLLAKRLGYEVLDTGATYRAVAYAAIREQVPLGQEAACYELAKNISVQFDPKTREQRVLFKGEDITDHIRTPDVSKRTSDISVMPKVREVLVSLQQDVASKGHFVVEGRDITTVVLKDSRCKIYLDASPEIRTQRRLKQMQQQGLLPAGEISNEIQKKTFDDIVARDTSDKSRKVGPLVIAPDAIVVDTGYMTTEQVVDELYRICQLRLFL
ncbi:MAG: CMP kinase, partial [Streblomastix strix]